MSKTALVTGAAGFIGRYLVRDLQAHGWAVRGLDMQEGPDDLTCPWAQTSILDAAALAAAMAGCDTVFHLAAHAHLSAPDPLIYEEINVKGTQIVLDCAAAAGVSHLIVTSSAVVWQAPSGSGVVTEASPLPPRAALAGPYARSKFDANALLEAADYPAMHVTRLYPTVPIGPGDFGLTAPTQMLAMFLNAPPPAVLDTQFDFVPVADVARAHRLAAETEGASGQQFLLSGERWTMDDVLAAIAPNARQPMPTRKVPYPVARIAAQIGETIAHWRGRAALSSVEGVRLARSKVRFSNAKARAKLSWKPGAVNVALSQALDWLER